MTASQAIVWFRRDLRLGDNPIVTGAPDSAAALFVIDPVLFDRSGDVRKAYLLDSLRALDASLEGRLHLRFGTPEQVVPAFAAEVGASSVRFAEDFAPYGRARDSQVTAALESRGVEALRVGSPYAVAPGTLTKSDGTPYRVYTPFFRQWWAPAIEGAAALLDSPRDRQPQWLSATSQPWPERPPTVELPQAGEAAAWQRWESFRDTALSDYHQHRDRSDLQGTSQLSAALRWGEIHSSSIIADLLTGALHGRTLDDPRSLEGADTKGALVYVKELAWREFYADVLFHAPESARASLDARYDTAMRYDEGPAADEAFDAWCQGRTGYPFVDAGMRQLLAEGWMHNRLRMVVASFLIKDLHLPWWRGAQWFMKHLRDGDLASNVHGWQWTAGCGTDAAPYFRVFNPVLQGLKFDPDGDYVRRYVPELRGIAGSDVHEPWKLGLLSPAADYPAPIVEHSAERDESLARFEALKSV